MTANANAPVSAAEILGKLDQKVDALDERLTKALTEPAPNLVKARATDGGVSYIERGEVTYAQFDEDNPYAPKRRYEIPKGFKPPKEWDRRGGLGEMIREGVNAHSAERHGNPASQHDFIKKYGEVWKGCEPEVQVAAGIRKAVQGMSEGVGSDGGFTVLPQFAPGILERIYENNLLAKTDGYTVTGNNMIFLANAETSRATGSRGGGIQGYYVAEGASITKSKPTLRRVGLRLCKIGVVCYLTDELLNDSGAAIEQYVMRYAAAEFNFMVGDALFNGAGGGAPLGFMNSPALVSVSAESGQPAATIQSENVDKMWARRLNVVGSSYEWYANQDTHPQLAQLNQPVGTAGFVLNRPDGSIATAPSMLLKGRPVNDVEFAQTLGTAGDLALVDFGQMLSITKGGISQEASIHLEFLTDQTAVRFIMRFDARPWDASAITPYKGSNTQSPFVVLATRS